MKNELKISTLSIVCVLCTAVAVPAFGASSVRSLGGVGTYSSASSAAAAKSNSTTAGATNSVRGGSLRVNNSAATGATRSSSTRASTTRTATTPRLSIGKYLGASSAISGGASRPTTPGQSGQESSWKPRVEALEAFMGFAENADVTIADKVDGLVVDVDALQADLEKLTGQVTTVDYADGELVVTQDGVETVFDLADDFATLADLEDAINDLVIPTKLSQLDNDTGFITAAEIPSLDGLITSQELADVKTALEAAIEAKQDAGDFADSAELTVLKNTLDSLQQGYNLTKADVTQLLADMEAVETTYATKGELSSAESELNDAISALQQGTAELVNYYKKSEVDAMLAQKADKTALDEITDSLADYAKATDLNPLRDSIDANADDIDANALAIAGVEASVDNVQTELASVKQTATDASNMANLNAADIKEIQDAGYITDVALAPYAKSADVQTTVDGLETSLVAMINEKHAAGEYATATALAHLQGQVEALSGGSDVNLASLQAAVKAIEESYATDLEVAQEIAKIDLTPFVKASDLGALAYRDSVDSAQITSIDGSKIVANSITAAQIADGSLTAAKMNPNEIEPGAMAMLQVNDETGNAEWVSVMLVDEPEQGSY